MAGVSFHLFLDGFPADARVLGALQQVEVEDHAEMACVARLRFAVAAPTDAPGWTLVDDGPFRPFSKVEVLVTVGARPPEPLIEADVVEERVEYGNAPGRSTLTVVAMDATSRMNREERAKSWPGVNEEQIASAIFASHGMVPIVEPALGAPSLDRPIIQRDTDIRFLQGLARRKGYQCYVEKNPLTRLLEGHFHPPRLDFPPQGSLLVASGDATNVDAFSVSHDMLRPLTVRVDGVDSGGVDAKSADVTSTKGTTLGAQSALDASKARKVLLARHAIGDSADMQEHAQSLVDQSAWAIRAEGELRAVAYGGVLRAKRTVVVRGAGERFSGAYYVERVHHVFGAAGYVQRFTLTRNGLGRTMKDRLVPVGAM